MTATAWKKPLLTNKRPLKSPLLSTGTRTPCVMTAMMITNMLINANVDALDNWFARHQYWSLVEFDGIVHTFAISR